MRRSIAVLAAAAVLGHMSHIHGSPAIAVVDEKDKDKPPQPKLVEIELPKPVNKPRKVVQIGLSSRQERKMRKARNREIQARRDGKEI